MSSRWLDLICLLNFGWPLAHDWRQINKLTYLALNLNVRMINSEAFSRLNQYGKAQVNFHSGLELEASDFEHSDYLIYVWPLCVGVCHSEWICTCHLFCLRARTCIANSNSIRVPIRISISFVSRGLANILILIFSESIRAAGRRV